MIDIIIYAYIAEYWNKCRFQRSALFPCCCRSIVFHFHQLCGPSRVGSAFGGPLLPLTVCTDSERQTHNKAISQRGAGKKFNCKLTECFGRSFVILARLLFGMFWPIAHHEATLFGRHQLPEQSYTAYARCRKLRGIRIADAMQFVLGSGLKIPL